jgi:arginine/ornithine N-succinyltransferase beta subunit
MNYHDLIQVSNNGRSITYCVCANELGFEIDEDVFPDVSLYELYEAEAIDIVTNKYGNTIAVVTLCNSEGLQTMSYKDILDGRPYPILAKKA